MMQGHMPQALEAAIRLFDRQFSYTHLIAAHQKNRLILALDIGGGNCSAAVINTRAMDKLAKTQKTDAIQSVHTESGKFKTFSVVGYKQEADGSETVYIGEDAERCADYIFTNFKEVPTTANLQKMIPPDGCGIGDPRSRSRETLMRDFIRKLYRGVTNPENNGCFAGCSRNEILVLVGKPSSKEWNTPEALSSYKKIITEATGGEVGFADDLVWSLSESSASILYMLKAYPPKGKDRILIIDLGAFSADITYLDRSTGKTWEASIKLGGKAVDRSIKHRVRASLSEGERNALKEELFDYFVRIGKEKHWPKAIGKATFKLSAGKTCELDAGDMRACVDSDPFPCESMSGEEKTRSYVAHLQAFLSDFVEHQAHRDANGSSFIRPDEVLIVGGAANMTPAYDAICDFAASRGWTNASIHPEAGGFTDDLIQYAVPKGLLMYYARAIPFVQELPALKEKLRACFAELLIPRLKSTLSDMLTDPVMNEESGIVIQNAKQWSASQDSLTYNDLLSSITHSLSDSQSLPELYGKAVVSACASAQSVKIADDSPLPDSIISSITMADSGSTLRLCEAPVNDAIVRLFSDYVSGLYTVNEIPASQQAQIRNNIVASLNASMSTLLQPQIRAVITYLFEHVILPGFVQDFIFALIFIPAVVVGVALMAIDEALESFRKLTETPAQREARLRKARAEQRKKEKQEERELKQKMAAPRTMKEREKLLRKLRSKDARSEFEKALNAQLPEKLPSILKRQEFDTLLETLISSLQEEIEKAAYC